MEGSVRVDKVLTELSVQYQNNELIAPKFMKDLNVAKESGLYYVYNQDWRLDETHRADGTPANMATFNVSTSSYVLNEHALKDVVTDRQRANVDPPLQIDKDTVEFLTNKLLLREEYDAAKLLFTTGSWSNNATLNTATSWAYNTTTSAPIQNILSATTKILLSGGGKANTGIISVNVRDALKENNNVYSRIQYVEKAILTEQLLASLFDLDNVYVGSAIYDTNKEGETASITTVWGDNCLIANFESNPRLKTKTAAVALRLSSNGRAKMAKRWRSEEIGGEFIEVSTFYKHTLIATSSAYYFKTVALA